jgi:hypothetical protein
MNELDMFTALRPEPARVDVTEARDRLTAGIGGAPGRRRKTRFALAGGLVAAAAAAIVVPSVLPGGAGAPKAWAVDRNPDGTVTVTIQQVSSGLAGLQTTLRADGVPATVAVIPWKVVNVNGVTQAVQACGYVQYLSQHREPESVQHAVVTSPQATGTTDSGQIIWIFHPAAMPHGSVLFIEGAAAALPPAAVASDDLSGPVVLRGGGTLTCVPGQAARGGPVARAVDGAVAGHLPSEWSSR